MSTFTLSPKGFVSLPALLSIVLRNLDHLEILQNIMLVHYMHDIMLTHWTWTGNGKHHVRQRMKDKLHEDSGPATTGNIFRGSVFFEAFQAWLSNLTLLLGKCSFWIEKLRALWILESNIHP